MIDLNSLTTANAIRWNRAKLTRNFIATAKSLVAAKAHYQAVEAQTGVPWFIVAVIHERESGQRWERMLAQGDPLNQVSIHVPKGRGPFKSWEEGAYDALVNCPPYAAKWTNWTVGGALCLLEQYNGLGYAAREIPSPYIWSGTDQYKSGKYVRDGVYDPNAVDSQLGCAGLLKAMAALDPSVALALEQPFSAPSDGRQGSSPSRQNKPTHPSLKSPSKGSIGAFVASVLAALFKRR